MVSNAGAVGAVAEEKKVAKYASLKPCHSILPMGIERLLGLSESGLWFLE